MAQRKSRYHFITSVAVFILLETASLWILSSNSDIHDSWVGAGMAGISANIWGRLDNAANYFSLKEENQRLAADNYALVQKLQQLLDKQAGESASWVQQRGNFTYMPCTVVTKSRNSQHNYLVVDRGSVDGVEEGDGIITPQGVLGVVEGTSQHYSIAVSIDNSNMSVSTKIGEEGFVGSMTWDGVSSNGAMLSGIPLHVKTAPGDTVFTSGFSSIFPADIPVAVVKETTVKGGSSAEISLELLEDFGKLRHVIIVKNRDKKELEELQK